MKPRTKRILLSVSLFGASLALCFGLGLLLYVLGESPEVRLGTSLEEMAIRLPIESMLFHVVEDPSGDISVFVDGVKHTYRVLSIQERVGVSLLYALQGHYGYAESMGVTVQEAIGSSLPITAFALGMVFAGDLLRLPFKKVIASKRLCAAAAVFFFFATFGFSYLSTPFLSYVCLGLCIWFIALWFDQRSVRLFFLLLFFGMVVLMLLGALRRGAGNDLFCLLWRAVEAKDNHLYAVATFFVGAPMLYSLCLALIWGKKKEETSEETNR